MEKIPDEILIEILSYMNRDELKTCAEVCAEWQNIIKASPLLMKKLKYSIVFTKLKSMRIIDDLEGGKHQNMKVFCLANETSDEVREKLFKYANSIKSLSLFSFKITQEDFVDILKHFPNLTHFSFMNAEVIGFNMDDITPVLLTHLENLEIVESGLIAKFHRYVTCPKLKSLKGENFVSCDFGNEFIHQLPNCFRELTMLKDNYIFARFFHNYSFKLEKLTMTHLYERELRSQLDVPCEQQRYCPTERFIWFFMRQKESLKELTIHNCPRIEMLRFIVSDLKLEKLTIGIDALQPAEDLFDGIAQNKFLKELEFYGEIRDWQTLSQIVLHYPAVQRLTFYNADMENEWEYALMLTLTEVHVAFYSDFYNEEVFNSIEDTELYISSRRHQQSDLVAHDKQISDNRIAALIETETQEFISLEVDRAMKISRNML